MVHTGLSAYAGLTRAMFFKDRDKSKERTTPSSKPEKTEKPGFAQKASVSPLGIPKSPSFHSGLDLVASSDNQDAKKPEAAVDNLAKSFRFASFAFGKDKAEQQQQQVQQQVADMNLAGQTPATVASNSVGSNNLTASNGGNGKHPQQNNINGPSATNAALATVDESPDICIKTRDRNYYHTNIQDLVQLPLLRGNVESLVESFISYDVIMLKACFDTSSLIYEMICCYFIVLDTPANERNELFVQKLRQCCVLFDFASEPLSDLKWKEVKRTTLLELVEYTSMLKGMIPPEIYPDIINMVCSITFLECEFLLRGA